MTPDVVKTYQVAISGLSGTFTALAKPEARFGYSNQRLTHYPHPEAPVWHIVDYSVTITNQSSVPGTRGINLLYERWSTYDGSLEQRVTRSLNLTLEPGESYVWSLNQIDAVGREIRCEAHIEDDLGDGTQKATFYR